MTICFQPPFFGNDMSMGSPSSSSATDVLEAAESGAMTAAVDDTAVRSAELFFPASDSSFRAAAAADSPSFLTSVNSDSAACWPPFCCCSPSTWRWLLSWLMPPTPPPEGSSPIMIPEMRRSYVRQIIRTSMSVCISFLQVLPRWPTQMLS